MTDVADRTALVTGGGNGIGRSLALALAAQGARVVVADILQDSAAAVAAQIIQAGGAALAVTCDVCERASIQHVKEQANARFGRVSLLFANAGASSVARLTDITDDEVDWMTAVNFSGVSNCLQAFLPDMVNAHDGHVVATASMAGLIPSWVPHHVPYTAAKGGVIAMMFNLRGELSEVGVGCTVLCPGAVATQISQTPRYRPARFGGPIETNMKRPEDFVKSSALKFRSSDEVAQMVLLAVRNNRPMMLQSSMRS